MHKSFSSKSLPMHWGRFFTLLFSAHAVIACGGSCKGPQGTTVTTVKTSQTARIVLRKEHRFTDRGSYDAEFYSIVIDGPRGLNFWIDCNTSQHKSPELSLDPKAERVAYRCEKGAPWNVYYLGSSSRLFNLCRTIPSLAWETIPSFEDERARLLECATLDGPYANRFRDLLKESHDRNGDHGIAAFLLQTVNLDVKDVVDASGADEWDKAWMKLPESLRRSKAAEIRALVKPGATVFALQRALKHSDLDGLGIETLESTAAYLAGIADTEDYRALAAQRVSFDIAIRALGAKNLPAAARISCMSAERFAANGKSVNLPRIELALIAASKLACRIDGVFDRNRCDLTFACCGRGFTCADSNRHPCTEKELGELVRLELAEPARNPWKSGGGFGYELLVAAARAQNSESAKRFLERVSSAPKCGK